MKRLLKYLKDYKLECFLGPLFKLLEATFELIIPLVVKRIVDVGIPGHDMAYIGKMVGLMLLFAVVGLVCALSAQYFSAKAAVNFAAGVKKDVFSHLLSLSYSEIDTLGTSTMITRLTSDIASVQGGVNMFLRLFLRSPFVVFGAVIMAFTIDFKAALIFVAAVILLSIVVYGIMALTAPKYRSIQGRLDKVMLSARSNLNGVRVIRAFGTEKREFDEFSEKNDSLTSLQIITGRISALMNPFTFIIINAALIYLLWTGGVAVDTGRLTQGDVVALVNYMGQILVELVKLANLIVQLSRALACADRIADVLDMEPSMKEGEKNVPAAENPCSVEFKDVSVRYAGASEEAIRDISFKVPSGSTVGIIGGTGSGKTSLVNLIPRFYDTADGSVLIDGTDVKDYTYASLRSRIAVVPQKSVLFTGTIKDNLLFGREDASDEEIIKALKDAQAYDFVMDKDGGLEAEVSQGGSNFSGGQRQRLCIARALIKHPGILIMDDSTSALDFATDAALRKAIKEMDDAPTLFIVSQRTASIMHADIIVVLDEGSAVGMGTHEELLDTCSVYREIYESQF